MQKRTIAFCLASVSSIMASSAVSAQNAAPAAAPASPPAAPTAAAPVAAGDIIVTAQRRSERLRDVPLSITALSAQSLANSGIVNTSELATVTPGLKWDHIGAFSEPAIRGVSTQLTQAGNETNVATYVDGIYQLSSTGGGFDLPDVSRVEVLKGPQGTLFGRNATGGAIQVVTLDPQDTFQGMASASYENYNTKTFKGYVTGPITQGLEFGLAGYYSDSDGYYDNLLTGRDHVGGVKSRLVRGKILIDPWSNFSILATAYYSKRDDPGGSAIVPLNGNTSARNLPGAVVPGPYQWAFNNLPVDTVESWGASVKALWKLDAGTITSLTGYTHVLTNLTVDGDFAYAPGAGQNYIYAPQREQAISEELNFVSRKMGILSFVGGFYYYNGYGADDPLDLQLPTLNVYIWAKQRAIAYAGYGEVYLDLTDKLRIIGGLRYTSETRSLIGAQTFTSAQPNLVDLGKRTDNKFTPRVSIKYALTDRTNIYFTFSQGFKSGAFNSSSVTAPQTGVKPENITAYEAGIKGRIGPLDVSTAGFYYNYKNIQLSAREVVNGLELSVLQNAAAAHIYGGDIDATLQVSPNFSVRAAAAYLHAKFSSFPNGVVNAPLPTGAGNGTAFEDLTGDTLIRSPKFTLTVTPNYATEAFGGKLNLSSTLFYTTKFFLDNADRVRQPAYAQLAANASWTPDGSKWTFSMFGKNLTNKAALAGALISTGGDGVTYVPPRTYGGSFAVKF
jgi:iron complex outermembrane receptor protein